MDFVKRVFLAAIMSLAGFSAANAYDGEQYVVCNLNPNGDNFLALRICGSTSCDMIRKLGPGTFVITIDPFEVKGWRAVIVQENIQDWSYSGVDGWVFAKYLCEVRY